MSRTPGARGGWRRRILAAAGTPGRNAAGWTLAVVAGVTLVAYIASVPLLRQHLVVRVDGDQAAIQFDGEEHAVQLPMVARYVTFPQRNPLLHEFQIDGSDSVNNQTLDLGYLATIANTPYFRLQSWLRNDATFSRWERVRLTDGAGHDLAPFGAVSAIQSVPLPRSFVVEADVYRLETSASVELSSGPGGTGDGVEVVLDRNDHVVGVRLANSDPVPTFVRRWYYPNRSLPYVATHVYNLAHLLLASYGVAAVVAVLALALGLLGRFSWIGVFRRLEGVVALGRAVAVCGAVLAATGLILYVADADFQEHPHIFDAAAYYFQGHLFSQGRLWAPAPPLTNVFDGPFTVSYRGRWFSQYPPGTALALALGFKVNAPWLVEPALAIATLLALYLTTRETSGRAVATLAVVLAGVSPFVVLQSGSFMSHPVSLFFLSWAYYAAVRFLKRPTGGWSAALFGLLSLAFATREFAALLFGVPLVVWTVIPALRALSDWRSRYLRLAPGIALGGIGLAGYLLYNAALTGDPFLPPRDVVNAFDRLGFGDGIGFYGRHTLAAGLMGIDEMLASLQFTLFGWPYWCSLAFLPLPFLLRRSSRWDRLNLAIFVAFLAGYTAYFYHGIALGPRYLYESLPALVQLTARGITVLAESTGAIAVVRYRLNTGWPATLTCVAAFIACDILYFMPRQLELYRQYTYIPAVPRLDLTPVYEPQQRHAVIVALSARFYQTTLFPLNSPTLDGDVVWAYMASQDTVNQLRATYPDRSFFYVDLDQSGVVQIVPLDLTSRG